MRAIKGTDIETDDVLVQRMLSGSTAAFDCLYERYFPRVYGFIARRISPESEVEDVVQALQYAAGLTEDGVIPLTPTGS